MSYCTRSFRYKRLKSQIYLIICHIVLRFLDYSFASAMNKFPYISCEHWKHVIRRQSGVALAADLSLKFYFKVTGLAGNTIVIWRCKTSRQHLAVADDKRVLNSVFFITVSLYLWVKTRPRLQAATHIASTAARPRCFSLCNTSRLKYMVPEQDPKWHYKLFEFRWGDVRYQYLGISSHSRFNLYYIMQH